MDSQVLKPAALVGESIGTLTPAAVPALLQALRDEKEERRRAAAEALGDVGAAARSAVPALREALRDQDEGVRNQAALALEKIQAEVRAAILRAA